MARGLILDSPRGFRCEFQDALCNDPRCKIGHCVPEAEINSQFNSEVSKTELPLTASEVSREAKAFARAILKERGLKPTKELVAKVIRLPRVQEIAERRAREMQNLFKISN